jgi:glycosyltransferase involved in cell wall biosynthesis
VVLVARSLESTGGAERQLAALAVGLRRRGHRALVACFYPGDSLVDAVRAQGVPVHVLDKQGRWDSVGFLRRLRRLLAAERPDIVQAFLAPPNIATALAKPRGARLVWGIRASRLDLTSYDWTHRLTMHLERAASSRADLVIANSFAGRYDLLQRGFAEARTAVVPNGIDTERFAPDRTSGAALRQAWLAGAPGPLIGMVARLDPMKDHRTFLVAARLFAADHPGARFVCVGTQPAAQWQAFEPEWRASGLAGRLLWVPPRDDMPAVMNALDALTLCSRFGEGFPNVLAEAMACGVPVVTTTVGDAASVVGDCGTVVPIGDAPAIVDAWRRLTALPALQAAELSARSRDRIVTQFSLDQMVDRLIELYDRLCRREAVH